jgi:hypothetical protein
MDAVTVTPSVVEVTLFLECCQVELTHVQDCPYPESNAVMYFRFFTMAFPLM